MKTKEHECNHDRCALKEFIQVGAKILFNGSGNENRISFLRSTVLGLSLPDYLT
ncbi:MAG: hypothetical protein IT242_05085 [Bacteroidia bacterium]|nr:hypothetical protein [Bacteroidia bacterium]